MGAIAEIFRTCADEYIARFGERMPAGHRKVIEAIRACRTAQCGINHYQCEECDYGYTVYRGCGNRHCPNCQDAKNGQWLQKKLGKQLPGPHFLVTFTVPDALRAKIRANQKEAYEALFEASSESLKALAADDEYVGGDLAGFFGVLHTWGRQLIYHPHIHYVVPGGAVDRATGMWKPSARDFFVPVRALSKVFRAKVRDLFRARGLLEGIDPTLWTSDWTVHSQAVGHNTEGVLKYLAPYVFRVAISDTRIIQFEDGRVTFRYRDTQTDKEKTMTLDALEFMRRFLQHVLPKGFMKIRYYGFMSPGCSLSHEELAAMIELALNFEYLRPTAPAMAQWEMCCPRCGSRMVLDVTLLGYEWDAIVNPLIHR